ncbi:ergothioneine biosynthesis protein EgtB [Pelagibaculum spongiae]|uniref:Ergothioneine biosynthesis protein EgtB n=1 Tax=Pelagibaculum spongiae TaxID=2080658 RepID=A0A2V1GY50_9GAMM|nr:ergothioneine biosynthesis protein EgtB [Pelagibaculum spongiae]PVZ70257.1 ergothioneine biosynthesis protein EgtB [Pelagibaculum spongiae]
MDTPDSDFLPSAIGTLAASPTISSTVSSQPADSKPTLEALAQDYCTIRAISEQLCQPLEIEDYMLQSMPDVSPTKWHLAHVSWFFETFILIPFSDNYQVFNSEWDHLFNSYYQHHGTPFSRPKRGLLSRPTVKQVYQYRAHIDQKMQQLLQTLQSPNKDLINQETTQQTTEEIIRRCYIGLNHEQQHQELLLTDIKYNLFQNPAYPKYQSEKSHSTSYEPSHDSLHNSSHDSLHDLLTPSAAQIQPTDMNWIKIFGGQHSIGINKEQTSENSTSNFDFSYDNEQPIHPVIINDFLLADRTITNQEFLLFIEDGGYQNFEFWLSDGWDTCCEQKWHAPLYWVNKNNQWFEYTLNGLQRLNPLQPVCHISFYEADAYARWAGCRLPTEAEWEVAAAISQASESTELSTTELSTTELSTTKLSTTKLSATSNGHWLEDGLRQNRLHPISVQNHSDITKLQQMMGNVWEWTSSAYLAYPGYKVEAGALGEYNGKFMCNQMVLRGGSCISQRNHLRTSYRNFFYPQSRWQFSGIRLAK